MEQKWGKDCLKIPNLLGYFRIILAFVFAWLYIHAESNRDYYIAALFIALSGLTDCSDGYIARKYNMVTELGKILDPIADKITQGVLVLCLIKKYFLMIPLFALFLIKECYMAVAGMLILKKSNRNEGAKWYGKVSTIIMYIVMFILVIFPNISTDLAEILIMVSAAVMLMAFVMYFRLYNRILKNPQKL